MVLLLTEKKLSDDAESNTAVASAGGNYCGYFSDISWKTSETDSYY